MEKKSKLKKPKKHKIKIKLLFLILSFLIAFLYTIKTLDKLNISVDERVLSILTNSGSNIKSGSISNEVVKYVVDLKVFNPVSLIKSNYKSLVNVPEEKKVVNIDEPKKDINNKEQKDPIVYIYNTHQLEEYSASNVSIYNIKPTVLLASYILQDKLNRLGINAVVENQSVSETLKINNWNYASSYKVTRMFLEQAVKDYPTLEYFIDVHRDSVARDKTTVTIKGVSYAKVFFLLGLDNKKSDSNKVGITKMEKIISDKYPGISRGIYEKQGIGVNGVYNQDFSKNCILIEIGGIDNNIEEVANTVEAIADMINIYIEENRDD